MVTPENATITPTTTTPPSGAGGGDSAPAGDVAVPSGTFADAGAPGAPAKVDAAGTSVAGASAAETQSSPDPISFGWDEWDGSVDALPEPARPWADPVAKYYQSQLEAKTAELSDWDRWFGTKDEPATDDTRLTGLTQQVTDLQKRYEEEKAAHAAYRTQTEAQHQAVQTAFVERFLAEHQATLERPGAREAFQTLISESVDIHGPLAIKLVEAGLATGNLQGIVAQASKLKADNVPDAYIVQLVAGASAPSTKQAPRAPEPSPTAEFVGRGGAPLKNSNRGGDYMSLSDMAERFSARARGIRG